MSTSRWFLAGGAFFVLYAIDQLSKAGVLAGLVSGSAAGIAIEPALNRSLAFSVPAPPLFSIVATVGALGIVAGMVLLPRHSYVHWPAAVSLLAGGAGNLTDRLFRGGVLDIARINTLQFNLADIYILVGILLWVVYLPQSHVQDE